MKTITVKTWHWRSLCAFCIFLFAQSVLATVALVAEIGKQAPGMQNGAIFWDLDSPVVNTNGVVGFTARLSGSGINSQNNETLWAGTPYNLQMIAQEGVTPAIPSEAGTVFSSFSRPPNLIIAPNGAIAFQATLRGPKVNPSNDWGIFIAKDGQISLVGLAGAFEQKLTVSSWFAYP